MEDSYPFKGLSETVRETNSQWKFELKDALFNIYVGIARL